MTKMSNFIFVLLLLNLPINPSKERCLHKEPVYRDFINATSQESTIYASIKDFPYMAKIQITYKEVVMQCGGTLVKPSWILTAAHCIAMTEFTLKKIHVCMGESYIPVMEHCAHLRRVKSVSRQATSTDLALLQLKEPYPITESIRPLPLRPHNMQIVGRTCKVMGWGWIQPGLASPNLLQSDVTVVDNCLDGYICTVSTRNAPCKGDSGGPLVCDGTLVGVISVGENADCNTASGITAYVSIGEHANFVEEITASRSGKGPVLQITIAEMWLLLWMLGI